jgi:2-oxoglutarate dehydrogenase E2 component (dihydrolipoamide succinyltransferase)
MTQIADVLVPANEEGTRATVLRWCKQVGETVIKDEPLVELETDKVTVEIAAPADGTLIEVLKPVDAEVVPDEVLARLRLAQHDAPTPLSPAVRRLLSEHSITASNIEGTGRDGRITAQDVTRHVADAAPRAPAVTPPVPPAPAVTPAPAAAQVPRPGAWPNT